MQSTSRHDDQMAFDQLAMAGRRMDGSTSAKPWNVVPPLPHGKPKDRPTCPITTPPPSPPQPVCLAATRHVFQAFSTVLVSPCQQVPDRQKVWWLAQPDTLGSNLHMSQTPVVCLQDLTPSTPVTPTSNLCAWQSQASCSQHTNSTCAAPACVCVRLKVSRQQTVLQYLSNNCSAGHCLKSIQ
jgi:hypothetical protein